MIKMRFLKKKYTIIDLIFILIGGKFFMDWLLPTNNSSKNIIWKTLVSIIKNSYSAKDYKTRYKSCFGFISVHIVCFIWFLFTSDMLTNILCNIYPIIVNIYIALRLKKVLNHKKNIEICIKAHINSIYKNKKNYEFI